MGRTREFDADEVVASAAELFGRLGYAGCSVDDLVIELGVHRGSLYRTFGSKHNLFVRALGHTVDTAVPRVAASIAAAKGMRKTQIAARAEELDIIVVGGWEASADPSVRRLVTQAVTTLGSVVAGAQADRATQRAAGVAALACRLASRSVGVRWTRDLAGLLAGFDGRGG